MLSATVSFDDMAVVVQCCSSEGIRQRRNWPGVGKVDK
jgi:hypothetical protein